MQQGDAADWGIIGSGVMENDRNMRQNLLAQDCLTTLIELDPEGGQATEIIGSMLDYIPIEDGNIALVRAMADPRTDCLDDRHRRRLLHRSEDRRAGPVTSGHSP